MNLEERTQQIFRELMKNPQLTSAELIEKLSITQGQLSYSLNKLNDILDERQLKEIKRTRTGHFLIDREIFQHYQVTAFEEISDEYLFSGEERIQLIQLMLLSKEEFISVNHFLFEFKVSRNTILRDLSILRKKLEKMDMTLIYTRSKGYYIEGSEWTKRNFLVETLNIVFQFPLGEQRIAHFSNISISENNQMKKRLEKVEKELSIQFTDERMEILPYLILLIIRRIKKGKKVDYDFHINDRELADTREYHLIEKSIGDVEEVNENERVYLTLLILTSNISKTELLNDKSLDDINFALIQVMDKFERIAGVEIENKEQLLKNLMVHMRPAYYRIKYGLNLQTKYLPHTVNNDLSSFFFLIKKALGPLESYFKKEIPDPEVFYISLFISSHILQNPSIKTVTESQKKAMIVCRNGTAIATLLKSTLQKLFPEINFTEVVSKRDFYKYSYEVDYVFSAVPLKTELPVFEVDSFLSEQDKKQLRKRFLSKVTKLESAGVYPEEIMTLIKKHVTLDNEAGLYDELIELFQTNHLTIFEPKKKHLIDLLNHETIQLFNKEITWEEVLTNLAYPLEEKAIISSNYIQTIQKEMVIIPEYIVLRNQIALPHTVAEAGAFDLGISMGIVKKGLEQENGQSIHLVILLASDDKEKHIDLLLEMMHLAGSVYAEKLKQVLTTQEAIQLLKEHNDEYWRN
ncbi:BglG family transcription antiterminator [Enterococcus italicus]|uniref:BglG family transcription antiterminator n=1 Tax=Enterococcus italicus TaxID=246144 RepID=UPI0028B08B1E|nr:BglG family transcription antiterminator [Enterococcus italicus]